MQTITDKESGNLSISRNDYTLKVKLRYFINNNPLARKYVKPCLKGIYHTFENLVPSPRDFILRKLPTRPTCCEVGVWNGDFSLRIYQKCKPEKLVLIDPWQFDSAAGIKPHKINKYSQEAQNARYTHVAESFKNEIRDGRVEIIRKTSAEALTSLRDNTFDLVYVDGNHDYEFVKHDIENYYPKVKSGGLLCGDDYRLPGVQKAALEFIQQHNLTSNFSVKNDQFLIKKP